MKALRGVLGSKAVKRPRFDFRGATEDAERFRKTAVAFEDLAVAAYKAQAPLIQNSGYLDQYGPRFRAFMHDALSDPGHKPPPPNLAQIDAPRRKAGKRA